MRESSSTGKGADEIHGARGRGHLVVVRLRGGRRKSTFQFVVVNAALQESEIASVNVSGASDAAHGYAPEINPLNQLLERGERKFLFDFTRLRYPSPVIVARCLRLCGIVLEGGGAVASAGEKGLHSMQMYDGPCVHWWGADYGSVQDAVRTILGES